MELFFKYKEYTFDFCDIIVPVKILFWGHCMPEIGPKISHIIGPSYNEGGWLEKKLSVYWLLALNNLMIELNCSTPAIVPGT